MYYIGIDLGTSAVKLLLMNSDGSIQKIVSRKYPISFPHPGWSEQNPEDWWRESKAGLLELTNEIDRKEVGGISFGGQMHGLVILDDQDRVIRPAILWNDSRTKKETEYLNQKIGRQKLSELTGNIAFTGFTAPKILWVRKNESENFQRISKIMLPKDYIAYLLTGIHSTDVSDASGTLLLDVKHRKWSKEMCEICGIREDMLPRLYESYECVGTLKQDVASELGFPSDCRVAAGAGDNAASAVGTGTVSDQSCNISMGTSGTVFISLKDFRVDENNALHAFCDATGKYHLMGCMLSSASCNQWWTEKILKGDFAEQDTITEDRLGENHVFFLPYLMGERSPYNNPNARATFTGMTMDTTRNDMSQAVLEGVAFAFRDMLEVTRSLGINVNRSAIVGGGSKEALWRKILRNVLNIRLDLLKTVEGPSMGGAILAAVACGEYSSVEEACRKMIQVEKTEDPDPELVQKYEDRYQEYRSIYPAMKPVFERIVG